MNAALGYLKACADKKKLVTIDVILPTRSINQNNFLHLLLGAFGAQFGYTLEESKEIYKELNSDVYAYKKKNRTFYRSSASLTTEEMTKSIDTLRDWSAKAGFPLPTATDQDWLIQIGNEIERTKNYL